VTFPQDRVFPPPSAGAGVTTGVVVALTVRKKSWVEARVDGTNVLSRVMEEGETHRLDAREAVTLSLGNAGGVEYSLNGRPAAPLGRDGEVRRNIVITSAGATAGSAGPSPIRAASPRPRRPSPTPPPVEETPAPEPSPAGSIGPAA
jgi:cytoskeleton protein RodZ